MVHNEEFLETVCFRGSLWRHSPCIAGHVCEKETSCALGSPPDFLSVVNEECGHLWLKPFSRETFSFFLAVPCHQVGALPDDTQDLEQTRQRERPRDSLDLI